MAALLALAVCAGILIRFAIDLRHGLWEDEIIAVTNAVQPAATIVTQVIRHDIHPPLYFVQLHAWAWISRADLWFVLNSAFWGLVALAALWAGLRRIGNDALAITATAVLAVLPAALWMSQEVRPYAWLSVLFIGAYVFAVRGFAVEQVGNRNRAALFALCLCIIYSHAIGWFAVLFNGLFAFALLRRRHAARREFAAWLAIYAVLAVASLPVLASDLMHDANLGDGAAPASIVSWCSSVITARDPHGWTWLAGALVYFGAAGAGLAMARTRLMTACFLVAPMMTALGLQLLLKPIFKTNFFATLLTPFIAIVLAELVLAVRRGWRPAVAAGVLAGLFALAVTGWSNKATSTDYRAAAAAIGPQLRPGDVVYAPQNSMFWGMAWYLDGPDWGSALTIAAPPNGPWRHVYALLGPGLVSLLHLMPKTQELALPNGGTMLVGNESLARAEQASRLWLVTSQRVDLPAGLPAARLGPLQQEGQSDYFHLIVTFYDRR